jgi:RNase P/RNase MRP subunit POP5
MKLYGEIGASQANLRIMEWNEKEGFFMVRCSHRAIDMVRAAASTVREVDSHPAVLYSIGVSGTIKALKDKFLVRTEQKPF